MGSSTRIWITYHDDSLIEQYDLRKVNDDMHALFATHKSTGLHDINDISPVVNEAATMYYVWKNQIKSDFVGFEHYSRRFPKYLSLKDNECQVYCWINNINIKEQYELNHNIEDLRIISNIIKDKYGEDSWYYYYFNTDEQQYFIPCEMFIMSWKNFNKLCNFIFGIYFEFDRRIGCNLQLENYINRYNDTYFMRAFYIERLISSWILNNFKSEDIFHIAVLSESIKYDKGLK